MYPGESGDQEGCSTALLWQGPLKPPDPLLVQLIGALSFTKTLISTLHGISLKIKRSKGRFAQQGNRKSAAHHSKLLTTH